MNSLITKIKEKREFSGLPDSLIERVLAFKQIKNKSDEEKVKLAREFLRKYFGVFMTNKVMKGRGQEVLGSHISSKKRDYGVFYKTIASSVGKKFKSIIDFGCGMNGFSYSFIEEEFGKINYTGFEATEQLCDLQNTFFKKSGYSNAKVIWGDLFDLESVEKLVFESEVPRLILLLQVVDALENIEPNFSKSFLLKIKENLSSSDVLVISNPMKSISGRNKFKIKRLWLEDFVKDNFIVVDKFELFDEEFLIVKVA